METRKGGRLVDRPEFKTKPKPVTFLGKDKVTQAIAVMADKNYGSVVIIDNKDKVVGIVTERDIVKKLVKNNMSPKTTKLEDIMTPNPRVANENDDVVDWLRIMSNDRFRRLPVVDDEGKIKVIFTQGDFVSYTWPDLIYQATQMTKATLSKHFNIASILFMILLYSVAIIIAVQLL